MFDPVRALSLPLPPRVRDRAVPALDTEIRARVPEPMPVGHPSQHSTAAVISLALLTRQILDASSGKPNESVAGLKLENLAERALQSHSMMVATIQHPKLQPVLFQITQQMEHLAGHQPELRQLVEAYQDAKIRRNPLDMALIVRAFLLTINTQIDTRVTNSGNEIVILDGKMRLNRVFNDAQPVSDRFTLRSAPEEHGIVYQLLGARSTVDAAAPLDRVDVYHPLIAQNRPGTAYPVPMTHSRNNPNAVEYIPYTTRALIASLKNSLEKKSTHTVYSVPRSVNIHEAQAQFRLPTDPKPVPAHRYAHYRHWSDLTVTRT